MKFKITFKDETKVVSTLKCYKDLVDYTQRVLAAENKISSEEQQKMLVKYLYIDEDNEQITISNENDFIEALTTVQDRNYLKIIVQELQASSQQKVQVSQDSNLKLKSIDALYQPASIQMPNIQSERKNSIPFEVIESQVKQPEQQIAEDQQPKFDLQKSMSDWIKAEVQKELYSAREQIRNSESQLQQQHLLNSSAVMVSQTNDSQLHLGYSCDRCTQNPIKGVRYHCSVCVPHYNLCDQCESESQHDPTHPFLKIKINDQQVSAIRSQRQSFVSTGMDDKILFNSEQILEDYSIEWENFDTNYTVEVGQKFRKFWRIKNTSQMTWFANQYSVFPADKETEQVGYYAFNLGIDVAPQKTIDIGLDFQAPRDPKTCKFMFCLKFDGNNALDMRGQNLVCEFRAMVMPSNISTSRILQDMLHVSNSTMMNSQMFNYPQQQKQVEVQNQFMNIQAPQILNDQFHQVMDVSKQVKQLNLDSKPAQDILIEKQPDILFNPYQNIAEVRQAEQMKQSVLSSEDFSAIEYASKVDTMIKKLQHKECMLTLLTMGFADFNRNYDLVRSENGRINYIVHYLSEVQ